MDGSFVKNFDEWVGCTRLTRLAVDERGMVIAGCQDVGVGGLGLWRPNGEMVGVYFGSEPNRLMNVDVEGSIVALQEVDSLKVHIYRVKQ